MLPTTVPRDSSISLYNRLMIKFNLSGKKHNEITSLILTDLTVLYMPLLLCSPTQNVENEKQFARKTVQSLQRTIHEIMTKEKEN